MLGVEIEEREKEERSLLREEAEKGWEERSKVGGMVMSLLVLFRTCLFGVAGGFI